MSGCARRLCFCGRAPRGFAYHQFELQAWDRPEPVHCCSMRHLDIIARRKGERVDVAKLDGLETEAVAAASEAAGAYLEQIGKSDLAQMSAEEWRGFLGHVYAVVAAEAGRLVEARETPF